MNKASNPAENTPTRYLIGFYDLGMFDEVMIEATDEETAREIFREEYVPKKNGVCPRIARCETVQEAQNRLHRGETSLPANDADWSNFGNAYFEALNH